MSDVTPKAIEIVEEIATNSTSAEALVEPLPDISIFECIEIIKAKVRRHHKKHAKQSHRDICACGSHHGGPYGTDACARLQRVKDALIQLEAELGRWSEESESNS